MAGLWFRILSLCIRQLDHKLQHCHSCYMQDQALDLGVGDTTGGGLNGRQRTFKAAGKR
jgi:hypothetical protein